MTEVHVEQGHLDAGTIMLLRDFGPTVRMAYDPRRITESQALGILRKRLPRLTTRNPIVRRIGV